MNISLLNKVLASALGVVIVVAGFTTSVEAEAAPAPTIVEAAPNKRNSIVLDVKRFVAEEGANAHVVAVNKKTGKTVFSKVIKIDETKAFQISVPLSPGTYYVDLGIEGNPHSFGVPNEIGIINGDSEMLFNGVKQMKVIEWTYHGVV